MYYYYYLLLFFHNFCCPQQLIDFIGKRYLIYNDADIIIFYQGYRSIKKQSSSNTRRSLLEYYKTSLLCLSPNSNCLSISLSQLTHEMEPVLTLFVCVCQCVSSRVPEGICFPPSVHWSSAGLSWQVTPLPLHND